MKHYAITLSPQDPELTIHLPVAMTKDLVKRSIENGRDINIEIMMRLARSLEKDLAMEEEDRLLAAECYFSNHR